MTEDIRIRQEKGSYERFNRVFNETVNNHSQACNNKLFDEFIHAMFDENEMKKEN